jgi:hypothetical protein
MRALVHVMPVEGRNAHFFRALLLGVDEPLTLKSEEARLRMLEFQWFLIALSVLYTGTHTHTRTHVECSRQVSCMQHYDADTILLCCRLQATPVGVFEGIAETAGDSR